MAKKAKPKPQGVQSARDREELAELVGLLRDKHGLMAARAAELCSHWGLRIGDLLAIETRQIDEALDVGEFTVIESKTKKSKLIVLSKPVVRLLTAMREENPTHWYLFQSNRTQRGTGRLKALDRSTVWKWIKNCQQEVQQHRRERGLVGRVRFGCHTFRKSAARLRLADGEPIEVISQFLNHATVSQTITYLDIASDDMHRLYLNTSAFYGDDEADCFSL